MKTNFTVKIYDAILAKKESDNVLGKFNSLTTCIAFICPWCVVYIYYTIHPASVRHIFSNKSTYLSRSSLKTACIFNFYSNTCLKGLGKNSKKCELLCRIENRTSLKVRKNISRGSIEFDKIPYFPN